MSEDNKRYDMLGGDDRDEAIRIKKIKQGLIPDEESENYQREKAEREARPVSLEEKWNNFWYHYKATVIIVGFLIVSVLFLTLQGLTKEKYDTTVLLCSYSYYDDTTINAFSKDFAKYMVDTDGNGEVNIGVFQANYSAPGDVPDQGGYEQALQTRIMAEIVDGENCIFILHKQFLDKFAEKEVFADLRTLIGAKGDEPVYGISLADSNLLKGKAFEKDRDNYYVAIRVYKEGTEQQKYKAQANAIKALVNDNVK